MTTLKRAAGESGGYQARKETKDAFHLTELTSQTGLALQRLQINIL